LPRPPPAADGLDARRMNGISRRLEWTVWGGLILVMVGIGGAYTWSWMRSRSGAAAPPLPVYREVADFVLTNQNNEPCSLASLRGKVWLADIIFTRCAGPCPLMSRALSELQAALPLGQAVQLVSLTADPAFDQPAVLKRYGERFKADFARWQFLTGPKPEIYRLATQGLMLVVAENRPQDRATPDDILLHSTKFILVDQRGRIRGVYDGESPEAKPRILEAIQRLLREG
jgi:protein SCO1/2